MRTTLAALTLTGAIAIAGCGGGGDDEATTDTAPPEPVAAAPEELVANAAGVTPEEVTCSTGATTDATSTTSTSTTATSTTASTSTTTAATDTDGAATCEADGTEYVIGNSETPIELETLTAELTSAEATDEVSGEYLDPRPPKNGVYLQAELNVINNGFAPAKFDDLGDQALLKVGARSVKEPFNVLNGVYTDSFLWEDQNIRPNNSASGGVIFDISTADLDQMNAEGNGALMILNFGDEGSARGADQIGLIQLPELAAPAPTEGTTTTATGASTTSTSTPTSTTATSTTSTTSTTTTTAP